MHPTDLVLLLGLVPVAVLVAYEWWAITNRTPGDSYTERTRAWFRTHTKRGAYLFLACLALVTFLVIGVAVWYAAHIVRAFI